MTIAAKCPVHGAFPSPFVGVSSVVDFALSGNSEPCPAPGCGRASAVIDGTFNVDAFGHVSVVSAPAWSREALAAVQGAATSALNAVEVGAPEAEVESQIAVLENRLLDLEKMVGTRHGTGTTNPFRRVITALRNPQYRRAALLKGLINMTVSSLIGAGVENLWEWATPLVSDLLVEAETIIEAPAVSPDSDLGSPRA